MRFIGQSSIMKQLGIYLPYLYQAEDGESFLVTGPSGFGKTRLCFLSCNYLTDSGKYQYCVPKEGKIEFDPSVRVHFFDEIHTLENPEFLYPILDSKKYVIFLATNESGNLVEPLVNRCIPLIFQNYSIEELREIVKSYFPYKIPDSDLDEIIKAGAENPRVITILARRLNMYIKGRGMPKDIKSVIQDIFGIQDGLDISARRYIEFLTRIGGRASIETLCAGLHINRSAILYQIEPILLYSNKIRITSKGRVLV